MEADAHDAPAGGNLAPEQEKKEEQVLKREGLEEELMDEDASEVGEQIDDVEDVEDDEEPLRS